MTTELGEPTSSNFLDIPTICSQISFSNEVRDVLAPCVTETSIKNVVFLATDLVWILRASKYGALTMCHLDFFVDYWDFVFEPVLTQHQWGYALARGHWSYQSRAHTAQWRLS